MEVRRKERKSSALLKDTRYLWLKNPENLTDAQIETMDKLKELRSGYSHSSCRRSIVIQL